MKKVIALPFVMLILLASCKKDSNNSNCDKTVANIAGTYSIVKLEVGNGTVFADVTGSQLETCQLDDKLVLNANGTTNYQDLGTVCSPNGNDTGTWSIGADGKMTINDGTVDASNADINSFDCSTLVLTDSETFNGVTTQYRLTLRK